jgi:hypothetical protein
MPKVRLYYTFLGSLRQDLEQATGGLYLTTIHMEGSRPTTACNKQHSCEWARSGPVAQGE